MEFGLFRSISGSSLCRPIIFLPFCLKIIDQKVVKIMPSKEANVLSWILLNEADSAEILQKKLPNIILQPSISALCAASCENQVHLFFSVMGSFISNVQYLMGIGKGSSEDSFSVDVWSMFASKSRSPLG